MPANSCVLNHLVTLISSFERQPERFILAGNIKIFTHEQ